MIPKDQNPLFIMAEGDDQNEAQFAGLCAIEYLLSLRLKGAQEKLAADPLFEEVLSSIHEILSTTLVVGVDMPTTKEEGDGSEPLG